MNIKSLKALECQKKMQANGYLTEAAYKADVQKLQNMAVNAQKKEQEHRRLLPRRP